MARRFYWPISPVRISQHFGENKACVDVATGKKTITCDGLNPPPGYKSVYSMMKGHNGFDLHALRWQDCYAAREGVVIEKETELSRGLGLGILHGPYEGKYYKTRYWHLIGMEVDVGDRVWTGQLIGYCDNTGYSSGDHLHFEIKECDRFGNTLNNDNGFFGAIDPQPLMFDTPAVEVNKFRFIIESAAAVLQKIIDRMRATRTA